VLALLDSTQPAKIKELTGVLSSIKIFKMNINQFLDDSGNIFILEEEAESEELKAIKQRQADCIRLGGVFFPATNQCCTADSVALDPKWNPGKSCLDPIKRKEIEDKEESNRRMIYIGAGVGVLAIGVGLWWWFR
jgi:hypothetical protein